MSAHSGKLIDIRIHWYPSIPPWATHLAPGELATNSTPLSILPFKPVLQVSRSSFSSELTEESTFCADSAPEGCKALNYGTHQCGMGTYAELDRHREKVDSRVLGDGIPTFNPGQVYIRRLNNPFLALECFDYTLSEPVLINQCYGLLID